MQKTTIEKKTAKITTTALLFFLALFTLTTCLIAQETQEGQTGNRQKKEAGLSGLLPICWVSPSKRVPVLLSPILQVAQWIVVVNLNLLRYCLLISVQQVDCSPSTRGNSKDL